jgi:formate hydrogenlyase subunit 3/multisubunit Na+/H+ antiporter MnhD subunit
VPLPLFFGVLTLAPAVAALLIAGLGRARRPIALAATALGALLPIAALLYLAAGKYTSLEGQRITLIGPSGPGTWLSLAYRYDGFAIYAAWGVALVIAPLLLWMVWRGGAASMTEGEPAAAGTAAGAASAEPGVPAQQGASGDMENDDADETADTPWLGTRPGGQWTTQFVPDELWAGFALVLGLEAAALVLCFADTLVWLGLAWIALAALAWGVGELGAEPGDLDRRGLTFMVAGPVLWLVAMLLLAAPAGAARLSDLAGSGSAPVWLVLLVSLILVLAGGAYPFNGWVRRRAIWTPPVGFAAVVLAALPAALFAGGRTYAAMQDAANLWPQLGSATPPITIGIVLVLLGALTIAICGLLALSFRDGRTLVALLASAQVGWGLLALGIGRPLSAPALVALLATAVFGLGAMVAALFAGGMLTGGDEPEGAGPQPFGMPLRPISLLAWTLGATALVGAPLFGGFIARHLTSAAALTAAQLTIPLTGLAWVGDALLALALVRATAPAWFAKPAGAEVATGEELPDASEAAPTMPVVQPAEALAGSRQIGAREPALADEKAPPADLLDEAPEDVSDEEDEEYEEEEEEAEPARRPWRERLGEAVRSIEPSELPGLALALLTLVIGIAPGALFLLGGLAAARALLQAGSLDQVFQLQALGYNAGSPSNPNEWLPSLAWIAVAILLVLVALFREIARPAPRVSRPIAGAAALTAQQPEPVAVAAAGAVPVELASLAEPGDAWKELAGTVDSGWTVPGAEWLLHEPDADVEEIDDGAADEAMRALREADIDGAGSMTPTPEPPDTAEGGNPRRPAGTRGEGTIEQQ